jgi:hypothetical protein
MISALIVAICILLTWTDVFQHPQIQISQSHTDTSATLTSRYLSKHVFEAFDQKYFDTYYLPKTDITHRNKPHQSTSGTTLATIVDQTVQSIIQTGQPTDETEIMKSSGFSFSHKAGVIILRCKNHPFIMKVFIENTQSLAHPFRKGLEAIGIFIMSGGLNRYLTGFSRVKNLYTFKTEISQHPYWQSKIDAPRAWFYTPDNTPYFSMYGSRFFENATYYADMPAIYAIICDEIFGSSENIDSQTTLQLFQDFDNHIDPNPSNFLREYETQKIVLIDAEYFPSIVGLDRHMYVSSYFSWYMQLAIKCAKDIIWGHA